MKIATHLSPLVVDALIVATHVHILEEHFQTTFKHIAYVLDMEIFVSYTYT